jgi:beta-glucanase (GH16 family)
VAAAAAGLAYLANTQPTQNNYAASPNGPWKAAWTEDFSGPEGSGINPEIWEFDTGQGVFGTNEIEMMTADRANVHLDGHGDLDLVVRGHGAVGAPGSYWTSGRIQTRSSFTPPPGGQMEVTASIWQPDPAQGLGYWPAFWMLGSDPSAWPADGEIDILEDINGLSEHSGTLHCGNLTQRNPDGTTGPCHEPNGIGSGPLPCPGCQAGFHSYSVVIDRRDENGQQIRWYLDGTEFFSVSESTVGAAAWTAAVDHPFSILLNVAVGGTYPDVTCRCATPTGQTTPGGEMAVRSVAVYMFQP